MIDLFSESKVESRFERWCEESRKAEMLLFPKSSTSEGGVKQVVVGNDPCKQVDSLILQAYLSNYSVDC